MKKYISLLLVLMMVFTVAACGNSKPQPSSSPSPSPSQSPDATSSPTEGESPKGDDDLAYILDKGELVIGYTDYAPMNYYNEDGELVGFDTEYAIALCDKLGVTPKFVLINWDTKEYELAAKTIDVIWNGLTVTEERRENMAFTNSYIINEQVAVIRAADAEKYTTLESLKSANLVAETGSAGESAANTDLAGASYTAVATQANALLEVKAMTADVAIIDSTMAHTMTGAGTDYADLIVIENLHLTSEEYAIGLRLGSTAVDKFNEITAELIADGTLPAIAEKYGLADRLIKG
ncbi:MAG TPA: transporter substrate-binding domain-containing protein [Papillibacter sp.]|nr:transporter substrate-binding domain-containing protein [Papillibacter sp.]